MICKMFSREIAYGLFWDTRLTDRISNRKLYGKWGLIPLPRAIMRERLRWIGHFLWIKDDSLPKIVVVGKPPKAKRKAGRSRMGWEGVGRKYLSEMGTSREVVKREALNRSGWSRSLCNCVSLRWLGATVSF